MVSIGDELLSFMDVAWLLVPPWVLSLVHIILVDWTMLIRMMSQIMCNRDTLHLV